jgi:hypothetical protein
LFALNIHVNGNRDGAAAAGECNGSRFALFAVQRDGAGIGTGTGERTGRAGEAGERCIAGGSLA